MINFKNLINTLFLMLLKKYRYLLVFIRFFYYLSRKFVNIYQKREKLITFYLIIFIYVHDL